MRKIHRGSRGKIAGICDGFGYYFGIDPLIFRLLFVLAFFTPTIPAILIYIIFWIVLPANKKIKPNEKTGNSSKTSR
jgi:phage shock protein C